MNRRAVVYTTLIPAVGLGMLFLSRREEVSSFIGNAMERSTAEDWRGEIAKQFQETSERITDTQEMLEDAIRAARERTADTVESAWERSRQAAVGATMTAAWMSLLTAFLVYVYAPERGQQEKIWKTTRSALSYARNTLDQLKQRGQQTRQSAA